ncbi:MAG: hypothetical protein FLDDKLPJ_01749 [Phycisphaerae bacterium]|nr:hypothetical protein [Phycisphaerae bacterium]
MMRGIHKFPLALSAVALLVVGTVAGTRVIAQNKGGQGAAGKHVTSVFKGAKVNGGVVMHEMKDGKSVLTLSDDFKSPDTPDPHWRIVDSKGNVHLLNRLMVKGGLVGGDKLNKSITLPANVYDVAKVQVWCAWAEALLGEASFESPVK